MAGHNERWEFVGVLGSGGQGTVHKVRDRTANNFEALRQQLVDAIGAVSATMREAQKSEQIDRLIEAIQRLAAGDVPQHLGALKVLNSPDEAKNAATAAERMRTEIDMMRKYGEHPNLLSILDSSSSNDGPTEEIVYRPKGEAVWFVSEFHSKGTLDDHRNMFKGQLLAAVRALRPLAEAVAQLHADKITHRDIKPQNVFIGDDGRLILGDFGLVFADNSRRTRVTETFENVGSWQWMPQWVRGVRVEEVNPSFDVFSLGKLLWAMLTGKDALHLWYFDEGDDNVQNMFPDSTSMFFANELFGKTIVQREADCLSHANEFVEQLCQIELTLENRGQPVNDSVALRCLMCGRGTLVLKVDRDGTQMHNFGFTNGSNKFRAYACDNCGNVQLFT